MASRMLSSTSAVPPGGSIMAAATSQDAMIAYCGDVDVCIRYASLKTLRSSLRVSDSCTMICEACEMPASSLCVECVANTIASLLRGRSWPMACMSGRTRGTPRAAAGFVEVQRVDVAAELFLDHFDVVDHAIVGALRQRQDARVLVDGLTREGIGLDLLADVVRVEFFQRDRPDDAQVVARRTQKHRDRARHGDGVQDRLVAVAIHHDHVAGGDVGVPYHLVRSGRAVGHEVAVVGVEDARGVQLGLGHRAGVVQQLAQFIHGVADVGAQHVLAEELVEHLAHGALQEGHAAGVAGAVPEYEPSCAYFTSSRKNGGGRLST